MVPLQVNADTSMGMGMEMEMGMGMGIDPSLGIYIDGHVYRMYAVWPSSMPPILNFSVEAIPKANTSTVVMLRHVYDIYAHFHIGLQVQDHPHHQRRRHRHRHHHHHRHRHSHDQEVATPWYNRLLEWTQKRRRPLLILFVLLQQLCLYWIFKRPSSPRRLRRL